MFVFRKKVRLHFQSLKKIRMFSPLLAHFPPLIISLI